MARKLARLIFTLLGAALGVGIVAGIDSALQSFGMLPMRVVLLTWAIIAIYVACGILFAIIFYLLSPKLIDGFIYIITRAESEMSTLSLAEIFFGVMGLVVGLLLAFLISALMNDLAFPWLRFVISIFLYVGFGYLGWSVVSKRRGEIADTGIFKKHGRRTGDGAVRPKILDTSVIIDGRIADICATGVIEGQIIVPRFVLHELQHIADSADSLKRVRGRRGLDILNRMQRELDIPIQVVDTDFEDVTEVDAKLLRLASDTGGVVVTNDYNLNKVAAVQNVPVLNINDVANAVKLALVAGDELSVTIVKEGKEIGQGIGYLDDGTMIVIDGGKRFVGENEAIVVTSVLQTSAGRMIFARLRQ